MTSKILPLSCHLRMIRLKMNSHQKKINRQRRNNHLKMINHQLRKIHSQRNLLLRNHWMMHQNVRRLEVASGCLLRTSLRKILRLSQPRQCQNSVILWMYTKKHLSNTIVILIYTPLRRQDMKNFWRSTHTLTSTFWFSCQRFKRRSKSKRDVTKR